MGYINGFEHTNKNGRNTLRGNDEAQITDGININDEPILMYGYGGDDKLVTGPAADEIYGGEGNDYLDGAGGKDELTGGNGDDLYVVDLTSKSRLEDKITEKDGNMGGIDTVKLRGESTLATYATVELANDLENLDASDTGSTLLNLLGNKLDNNLIGNDADNVLDGGKGLDSFAGGKGNDIYVLDLIEEVGHVTEYAGEGVDTIVLNDVNESREITYGINLGAPVLANVENFTLGGAGLYDVTGNALDNVLTGNESANALYGAAGNDVLNGGLGADILQGDAGADTFVFSSKLSKNNIDSITDFVHGEDKIHLDTAIFKKLLNDTDLSDNLVIGSAAKDSNDYLIYNSDTGALFYDADGSGKGAAVQFASLADNPVLDVTDFSFGNTVPVLG